METGNFKLNYLKCFDLKRPSTGQNILEQTGIDLEPLVHSTKIISNDIHFLAYDIKLSFCTPGIGDNQHPLWSTRGHEERAHE